MVTTRQAPWELGWKDYYQILGIPPHATAAEIREAYRYLAFVFHPDRFPDGHWTRQKAEEDFRRINEAYEVLSDPALRQLYDRAYQRRPTPEPASQGSPSDGIKLEPAQVTVTGALVGQPLAISFTLDLPSGGQRANQLHIQPDQPWVSIVRLEAESLSPPHTFPLRVTIELDTHQLKPGETYEAGIHVLVKRYAACLNLVLSMEARAPAGRSSSPPWDGSADHPSGQEGDPLWLFRWLPPRWQVGLALLGGIVAPGYTAAWSIAALLAGADFPLVKFTGALLSIVPYFDTAWAIPATSVPVAATTFFALGVHCALVTRLLSRLTSCSWPAVMEANVVGMSGLVAAIGIAAVLGWFLLVMLLVAIATVLAIILGLLAVAVALALAMAIISAVLQR